MSFHELKLATLVDIVNLRQTGLVPRRGESQAILDGIARDIRSKRASFSPHLVSRCWVKGLTRWLRSLADHRRVQREQELHTMHATLASLRDNMRYLGDQITSYHVYIDQSMAGIQKKRCAHAHCLLPATRGILS